MTTSDELREQRDDAMTRAARSNQEAAELRAMLAWVTGTYSFDEYGLVGREPNGQG